MDIVRLAQGGSVDLGQAEVQDFAFGDQPGHCPYRLLDRDLRVDAVEVVEVDVIGAEPPQGRFARRLHVVRTPVQAAPAVGEDEPEPGCQTHSIPAARQGMPHQSLVGAIRIRVRGVEKEHSELECSIDGGRRARLAAGTVDVGHGHAAEPKGGHP